MGLLRLVAAVSGAYDLLLGGALLFAPGETARLLGVPEPAFPIHANLNGLFALAVGAGYFTVLRDPERGRAYLWIMGPFLKGGGAVLFVLDFLLRGSPPVFLLFALSDGTLAAATVFALTRRRAPGSATAAAPLHPPEPGRGAAAAPTRGEGADPARSGVPPVGEERRTLE